MGNRHNNDQYWASEGDSRDWEDDDDPDEEDYDDDEDGGETVPCPNCGHEIYEDSERCPYCEDYITSEEGPQLRKMPWWFYVGLVACLYAIFRWVSG